MQTSIMARRTAVACILAGLSVAALAGPAFAEFPDRPIRIIVPFAPNGGSDLIARVMSGPLSQELGQTVIIDNHPGANGNIGIGLVAKAPPDGYTLLVASSVIFTNAPLKRPGSYDGEKDFAPVADLGGSPNAIITNVDSDIKDINDLIKKAKAAPGKYNYATPGVGSVNQLAVELLDLRAGISLTHVPFTGAGPSVQAVLSNTTQLAAVNISAVIPLTKAGKVRALVQTGNKRWFELPDVPTMEEAGIPNASSEVLQVLLAPKGTPQKVVDRIAAAVVKVLARPEIQKRLLATGFAPTGRGPAALKKLIHDEDVKWAEVIKSAGLGAK
jgi:tripartite-type tricarboxylate transporter receptor subunit TctC